MITRSTLYSARGGDTVQALQTARLLENYGIAADVKLTHEKIDYDHYQLLHFFNITRPADILHHIQKTNIPFVVSTILVNYSEYDKKHRSGFSGMLFRYLAADTVEYIKALLRWIRGSDRMMSLSFIWKGQKRSIHEILAKTSLLLPNSFSEYTRLSKMYSQPGNYLVVPNAVDSTLFRYNSQVKKEDNLILCVARIEGIKNQLNLVKALNNTKYRLLIIGDATPNQLAYYEACRRAAADNIHFIPQLPQQELVPYYQRARVHVLPSWFETTGLSSLEAAAMGCTIVVTAKGDTREYFGDAAVYCDPACSKSIYEAVATACLLPPDEALRIKIATQYTWQQASQRTAEGYKKIIPAPCH